MTKDEVLHQKLKHFLTEDRKHSDSNVKQSPNPELKALKERLSILVNLEFEANPQERDLIRRQKSDLVSDLRKLEAREREERIRIRTGMLFCLFGDSELAVNTFRQDERIC
jgi:hypothetical protein